MATGTRVPGGVEWTAPVGATVYAAMLEGGERRTAWCYALVLGVYSSLEKVKDAIVAQTVAGYAVTWSLSAESPETGYWKWNANTGTSGRWATVTVQRQLVE